MDKPERIGKGKDVVSTLRCEEDQTTYSPRRVSHVVCVARPQS